jgi:hypothetical protein
MVIHIFWDCPLGILDKSKPLRGARPRLGDDGLKIYYYGEL